MPGQTDYSKFTAPTEQPPAGQDIALILILLAVCLYFLARNMQSFKGLKIRGPDGKPTDSETEGVTTAGEEEEEEEELEEEGDEDQGDGTKED